ncbi:hypothetical protein B0H14DRAFT_2651652 [Mycena olivaceomarginata]|nr:hypothetical protein B0H14DRAFT_2651652 [Mycena olivaceomarginata]
MSGRCHLRSGKEFSPFDLALGLSVDFDITACLQWRISEAEADQEYNDEIVAIPSELPESPVPPAPAVHVKRVSEAKPNYLKVVYDANGLPHSIPAWIGDRTAPELQFIFDDSPASLGGHNGIGGRQYTQSEVDALTGTCGFKYIGWLGMLTITILDSRRQVIALLGGMPKDTEDTKESNHIAIRWAAIMSHVAMLWESGHPMAVQP